MLWDGSDEFDLSNEEWHRTLVCILGWLYSFEGRNMVPSVCTAMQALVLESDFEWRRPPHRLFVLGGSQEDSTHTAEVLDPCSQEWTPCSWELPRCHSEGLRGASLDAMLVLLGGNTDQVHRLNAEAGCWEPLAPMLTVRTHSCAVVHDGKLMVIGGKGPSMERSVFVLVFH